MTDTERDKNLIVVAAIDKYADMHNMATLEAFNLFIKFGVTDLLRDNYETLHTQDLFEGAYFADDYIKRQMARIKSGMA